MLNFLQICKNLIKITALFLRIGYMFFRQWASVTGSLAADIGGMEAGFQIGESLIGLVDPATPGNVLLCGLAGSLLTFVSAVIVSVRLLNKYVNDPLKAIGSQLLLGVSTGILCKFVNALILSAFVSTAANPFTLPFMIAVGASALCFMALYWISRPKPRNQPIEHLEAINDEDIFQEVPVVNWAPAPIPAENRYFTGTSYRLGDFN